MLSKNGLKKALLVTRVSGFIPQFEMNNVKILQEMGYEVHYASNFKTVVYGKDNKRLKGTGIKCHQIDFERSPLSADVIKSYHQMKELLIREKFDIIHCHMPMSGVITRIAAQRVYHITGRFVPVLYTAHGFHFYTGAPFSNWIYYPIERYLARFTDKLILINKEDYKRALKFKVRGSVEHTMGIGLDLEKFKGYEKKRCKSILNSNTNEMPDIKKKYNIPLKNSIIISVGELTKRKNNLVVMEAMAKLKDLDITYILCGTGPLEQDLKKKAMELGLLGQVIFAGYVDNVPEMLVQSDCFVFPSFQEGLPVAVMEAMAVGLPVIASKIRGITDLIEQGRGGYLANGFKPEEYASIIRRMFGANSDADALSMRGRRQRMGEWNRNRIKKFALPVVDAKMREIYKGFVLMNNNECEKILTISVAAYNVEKYLKKCLNSFVAAKSLKDIEVLIINDGSKDRTLEIARQYEKKYHMSFKVIDKENGGHGSTINCAVRMAKGKYFKVIDSDDWVRPSELDKLVLFLKNTDVDMAMSHFDWVTYDCRKCIRHFNMIPEGLSYHTVYQFRDISDKMIVKMHSVTFRTDILKKNNIKIDENCFYVDQEFCMYPTLYCKTAAFVNADITQYRLGQSGQSMSRESMQKNVLQHYHVLLELLRYYENAKRSNAPQYVLKFMQKHISYMVGSQIKIYLSFPASAEKKQDIIMLDKKMKKKYPEIYSKVENKAVWLLRKTNYGLYGAAVFSLRLLWK